MFRQFLIKTSDRVYQHVFWRNNPEEEIKEYELTTVPYELTCSPYMSMRVLKKLAIDEGNSFPLASKVLLQSAYVDDILAEADSLDEARILN